MALPALRAVRIRFPEAGIAILARPHVADIYRDQQICDQFITYELQGKHSGLFGRERLARELRALKKSRMFLLQLIGNEMIDRKSTRMNSSHSQIYNAVICLNK